jgi:hypothetical protein
MVRLSNISGYMICKTSQKTRDSLVLLPRRRQGSPRHSIAGPRLCLFSECRSSQSLGPPPFIGISVQSWVVLTDTTHFTICEDLQASSNIAFDVCQTGKTSPFQHFTWCLTGRDPGVDEKIHRLERFRLPCLANPTARRFVETNIPTETCAAIRRAVQAQRDEPIVETARIIMNHDPTQGPAIEGSMEFHDALDAAQKAFDTLQDGPQKDDVGQQLQRFLASKDAETGQDTGSGQDETYDTIFFDMHVLLPRPGRSCREGRQVVTSSQVLSQMRLRKLACRTGLFVLSPPQVRGMWCMGRVSTWADEMDGRVFDSK